MSALCAHLDPRVRAFNERRLTASYPFVRVDVLGLTVREDDRVVSKAALIAMGIRDDGVREILGLQIVDSESFAAWEGSFKGLKGRGLRGVLGVISTAMRVSGRGGPQAVPRGLLAALSGPSPA